MTNNIDLKNIEKDAYCKSNVQDGLFDIMLGMVFFVPTLLERLHLGDNYMIPIYGVMLILFSFLRRKITVPRVGKVKFGPERKKKLKVVSIVLAASVAVLIGVIRMKSGAGFGAIMPLSLIIVVANIIIIFSFMAYFMNNIRFYFYGILLGITIPLARYLEVTGVVRDRHIFMLLASGIILLTGIVTFVRFLKSYQPLINGEM